MFCLQGVPDVPREPPDEAGLTLHPILPTVRTSSSPPSHPHWPPRDTTPSAKKPSLTPTLGISYSQSPTSWGSGLCQLPVVVNMRALHLQGFPLNWTVFPPSHPPQALSPA